MVFLYEAMIWMLCRYEVSAVSNTEDLFNGPSSIPSLYMILDIVTKIPNRKCNVSRESII